MMGQAENPEFLAMRERNGAKSAREREGDFEAIRARFCARQGVTDPLSIHKNPALLARWQEEYKNSAVQWCGSCRGYHQPTKEHPFHALCESLHERIPADLFFDYRGWKFTAPFICMCCGIEICFRQWAFSRSCGPCDISDSKTHRVLYGKCFAGPHVKLETWKASDRDIPESHFVDPADRLEYPVMLPVARRPPPPPPKPKPRPSPPRPQPPLRPTPKRTY